MGNWFFGGFILTVAMLHVVNNLELPVTFTKSYSLYAGATDAMVQWWYGHNAVGFFLTAGFLGMMYYFVPKQAERPVGGDLADRVAVAVGEDHRGPGFRRTADDDSIARIDHRRRRGDGIDGDAGRTAGIAGRVLGHGVDHRAVGQRGARGERPVAAAVGGGLADRTPGPAILAGRSPFKTHAVWRLG